MLSTSRMIIATTATLQRSSARQSLFPKKQIVSDGPRRFQSSSKQGKKPLTEAERDDMIRDANRQMKGYVETRLLAKRGLLKSKGRGRSEQFQSQNILQLSMMVSMLLAFMASPMLGKKIAQDEEFRKKYIPDWYDFRLKSPESAWTRQELHEQLVEVEKDMRERAARGEFAPDKLAELKRKLQPRSDLTDEDLYYAEKYGWGKIHPGVDLENDDDEFDEDD